MNRHSMITWGIGLLITFILFFFGLRYAVGMLAGLSFSYVHLRLKANYIGNMLFFRNHSPFGTYVFFTLGMLLLCIPLLLGALYPQRINIFTAAFGILFFKYEIFVKEMFFRRKEE